MRILLVAALVLVLLGDAWWLLAPRKPLGPDAEIEVTLTETEFSPDEEAEELARMPRFDPSTGGWIAGGKLRRSAIDLIPPHTGPWGVDDIGTFLMGRLPDGAGMDVMLAALRALADDGICQVALFADGMKSATVIRIRRVADGRGGTVVCRNRVDPYAGRR